MVYDILSQIPAIFSFFFGCAAIHDPTFIDRSQGILRQLVALGGRDGWNQAPESEMKKAARERPSAAQTGR